MKRLWILGVNMGAYDDFYSSVISVQTAAQQDAAERARISQMQAANAASQAATKQVPVTVESYAI